MNAEKNKEIRLGLKNYNNKYRKAKDKRVCPRTIIRKSRN